VKYPCREIAPLLRSLVDLKLNAIFLSGVTLASAEAVPRIRGAEEVTHQGRFLITVQGGGPVKERSSHGDAGTGGAIKSLSVSAVREHR
jgi:hypothetical protein